MRRNLREEKEANLNKRERKEIQNRDEEEER